MKKSWMYLYRVEGKGGWENTLWIYESMTNDEVVQRYRQGWRSWKNGSEFKKGGI